MKYTKKGFLLPEESDFFSIDHANENAQKTDDLITAMEKRNVDLKTEDYTVTAGDLNKTVAVSGGATVILPAIAADGIGTGFRLRISNIGTDIVTAVSAGTDKIAGDTAMTITKGKSIELTADTAGKWNVLGFDFEEQIDSVRSMELMEENIPVSERRSGRLYFKITDKQSGGGFAENIKVSPTIGLKIEE